MFLISKTMTNSLNIIMFSGTADKFIPLGLLTQSAANPGVPVNTSVCGFETLTIKKDGYKRVTRLYKEFEDLGPAIVNGLKDIMNPSWYDMIKSAKEIDEMKVYFSSLKADALKINSMDELDPIVDEILVAGASMHRSAGGQVIFI